MLSGGSGCRGGRGGVSSSVDSDNCPGDSTRLVGGAGLAISLFDFLFPSMERQILESSDSGSISIVVVVEEYCTGKVLTQG